ncbi:MAG: hypothetical protein AAF702_34475 [Chloroflexota bacterium]
MIEELLEALLEGSQPQQQKTRQKQAPPSSPWMDLLEGVLGGSGQQSPAPREEVSSFGIGDILDLVLGGGQQSGGQQSRGRQSPVGGNPLLAPFTAALAEKLGISPQMASVIVSAAFGLLMGKLSGKDGALSGGNSAVLSDGLDLDDLLDGDFLEKNGVTEKVARQTGMDAEEAQQSLLEALELLGLKKGEKVKPIQEKKSTARSSKSTSKKSAPAKSTAKKPTSKSKSSKAGDLKDLLDDWNVHG